ncbi:MAG: hypothetical protein AB7O52_19960 [Planctomycetota bacterium]
MVITPTTPRGTAWKARAVQLGCATLVCLFGLMPLAPANEDGSAAPLPSPEKVLAQLIEAAGGEKALAAIDKQHVRAVMKMPAMGMQMTMTTYAQDGNFLLEVEMPGMGKQRGGKNGEVVWSMDPMTGPRILTGVERTQYARMAEPNPLASLKTHYVSHECVGMETVNGTSCYKLKLTPTEGKPETWFADAATWRPIQMVQTMESPMGEINSVTQIMDYQQVAGCWIPFKMAIDMQMQKLEIHIEKFETEFELPAGAFDLPPEVIALAKKQASPGTGEASPPPTTMPKAPEGEKKAG